MHDHREVRRTLERGHAQTAHFFRELGQRLIDAVLHFHLSLVQIRAQLEGHRQRHDAVRRPLRTHVQTVLDPVDRFLQRRGHRGRNHVRTRSRINRPDDNRRRRHFGILADRQKLQRNRAHDDRDDR